MTIQAIQKSFQGSEEAVFNAQLVAQPLQQIVQRSLRQQTRLLDKTNKRRSFHPIKDLSVEELRQKIAQAKQNFKCRVQQIKGLDTSFDFATQKIDQLLAEDLTMDLVEIPFTNQDFTEIGLSMEQEKIRLEAIAKRVNLAELNQNTLAKEFKGLRNSADQIALELNHVKKATAERSQRLTELEEKRDEIKTMAIAAHVQQKEIEQDLQGIEKKQKEIEVQDNKIEQYQQKIKKILNNAFRTCAAPKKVKNNIGSKGKKLNICGVIYRKIKIAAQKTAVNKWNRTKTNLKQAAQLMNSIAVPLIAKSADLTSFSAKKIHSYIWRVIFNQPITWFGLACFAYQISPKPIASTVTCMVSVAGITHLLKNKYRNR
jgi:hypothetical protein